MPAIAVRTHKLSIEQLKGVRGLDEISFEDKPLTGIFGPNGVGKSTILQALAAAYSAPTGLPEAPHYGQFFPRLAADVWNGSKFTVEHTIRTGAAEAKGSIRYRKGTVHTRWTPIINRRPERHVTYIGVRGCVPDLEAYSSHDLTTAVATPLVTALDNRVREAAGAILNCTYTAIATLAIPGHPRRKYSSLTRADIVGVDYPSVVMGAGEQRLFRLLSAFERTRDRGLVLIDELDLLLHGDALNKLVAYLTKRCADRSQQVVFTSHREELLDLGDQINIRHVYPLEGRHQCFANTDPDSLHRLTGERLRPIEVFVEDPLAEAIASHVAGELGMHRHVQIIRFGAASNCFTVLAGLLMQGEACDNSLFLLDGDVYLDPGAREGEIARALTGNDVIAGERRTLMATHITDLALPPGQGPERFLNRLISEAPDAGLSADEMEIRTIARTIVHPPDPHGFIYELLKQLGEKPATQLSDVVRLAAKHLEWTAYTEPVRTWLAARKAALGLP